MAATAPLTVIEYVPGIEPAVAIVVIEYFAFFYTAHLDEKRVHGENATAIWYFTSDISFGFTLKRMGDRKMF